MGRLSPPQILVLSFLIAVILGTIVLSFPIAHSGKDFTFVDCLFTATSAVCVTGLTVRETGEDFSSFGKGVILFLIQLGGLGIMTLSTFFAVLLGRKISFKETDVMTRTFDRENVVGLKKLLLYVMAITFTIEAIGTAVLFLRWRVTTDWSPWQVFDRSLFHSISAFCNAGFSVFSANLMEYRTDVVINLTIMLLIIFGGLGFVVIVDILGFFFNKKNIRKISLQSKVVIRVSLILILFGAFFIYLFEKQNTMAGITVPQKILSAFFQSVTARTAGFNTLDIGQMTTAALILIISLMFIGASPGSTGGGIKTSTFAVMAAIVASMVKDQRRVTLYNRSLPRRVIREAIVIFFLALTWVFIMTLVISFHETGGIKNDAFMIKSLFEVTSAFGTVGLSTGITPFLSDFSKICIIITMFMGRVGVLTMILALAIRTKKYTYSYPEEEIMVG